MEQTQRAIKLAQRLHRAVKPGRSRRTPRPAMQMASCPLQDANEMVAYLEILPLYFDAEPPNIAVVNATGILEDA